MNPHDDLLDAHAEHAAGSIQADLIPQIKSALDTVFADPFTKVSLTVRFHLSVNPTTGVVEPEYRIARSEVDTVARKLPTITPQQGSLFADADITARMLALGEEMEREMKASLGG